MSVRPDLDTARLLDDAAAVLDSVTERFIDGLGAPSAVTKGGGGDFATELDLELERIISAELGERTGIGVHGEEFGGPAVDEDTVWIVDPIDGTFNYSAGLQITGMLLALVSDGQPVLGLTWLPLNNLRYQAHIDGPVYCNGEALPTLSPMALRDSMIGYGAFNAAAGGRYPGQWRVDVLGELSRRVSRIRMFGSTGVDMAYTAAGTISGAITFGGHPWDNAPGAALVRAAGGVISDVDGNPWTVNSPSLVAAAPGVHEELIAILASQERTQ
ncbi:inositol monophosphatase family protein [Jongsikchunia kroppenstedtii]|uniref:inositol monophosphatase family protein n=1 Tax=Jongsikchunia kroppenstedtii TaxID=1121721 RepID=UPI00037A7971|nr:inositol monophosphatase family protein [Jongsikchunia kroppenstedtii]